MPKSCQWVKVSDDSVREVDEAEVLDSEAFMLFYEQQRPAEIAKSAVHMNGHAHLVHEHG